jgi:hypothetical protein
MREALSMNSIKQYGICLILLTSTVYNTASQCNDDIDSLLNGYFNHDAKIMEFIDEGSDDKLDFLNEILPPTAPMLKMLDPFTIVQLLVSLNVIPLLEQDFFLSTNRPARRSYLDMPLFQPNKAVFPIPCFFNTQLFFDYTPTARFTRTSSNIDSYIATNEPSFLAALDGAIKALNILANGTVVTLNIPLILEIISDMTLVERNIGFMFQTGGRWDRLQLRIFFPLYYHERNFFLSQNNLDTLALQFGFTDADTFDDSFAICDRLGFGDTRVEFGVQAIESQWCDMVLSLYATLPTAFSIFKGMAGNTYKAPACYPSVNFEALYAAALAGEGGTETLAQQEQAYTILTNFLLDAWTRIDAALLDNGLGNEGHIGLGGSMAIDARLDQWVAQPWASCTYWHNRVALEYLFKNDDTRFYVAQINPDDFPTEEELNDPTLAQENLNFIQNTIIQRLCLLGLSTSVQPGIIGWWKSALVYQDPYWGGYAGTDLWFQTKEKHGCIRAPDNVVDTLSLCKSVMPWAFQYKFIAGFGYTHYTEGCTMTFGIDGDVTLFTTGVGRNYMVTLRLDVQF